MRILEHRLWEEIERGVSGKKKKEKERKKERKGKERKGKERKEKERKEKERTLDRGFVDNLDEVGGWSRGRAPSSKNSEKPSSPARKRGLREKEKGYQERNEKERIGKNKEKKEKKRKKEKKKKKKKKKKT